MCNAARFSFVVALASCLNPYVAHARPLRQPSSVLPLVQVEAAKNKKAPQKRVIIAPRTDEIPQWLQQASKMPTKKTASSKRIAKKTTRRSNLPMVEAKQFDVLGDIDTSSPRSNRVTPTKRFRPQISPSVQPVEGPELRIPGLRRVETSRTAKRLR